MRQSTSSKSREFFSAAAIKIVFALGRLLAQFHLLRVLQSCIFCSCEKKISVFLDVSDQAPFIHYSFHSGRHSRELELDLPCQVRDDPISKSELELVSLLY